MPTQNLGINISSDVGGAVPGINSVSNSLNALTSASTLASRGLTGLTPASTQAANGMAALRAAVSSGGNNLSQFSASIGGVQRSLTNSVRPIGNASAAVQNLGRVLSDAPFGFIAIQNNLDPLIDSFSRLSSANGGLGGAFKALGATLAGPAGIALAFTAVSSGITFLIQKYGSLGNAFAALNPFIDSAERNQIALSKAQLDGGQAAQEEVSHLTLLYRATQDLNVPLGERRKIVDQLQKQYPDTFKGLSDEAILAGDAADAYAKLTQSLIAAATVKAVGDLVTEQQKKLFALKIEAQGVQKVFDLIAKGSGSGIVGTALGLTDQVAKAKELEHQQARLNANKQAQKDIESETEVIIQEQLKLIEQYGAAALKINAVEPKKIQKTDLEKLNEILKGIDASFLRLDSTFAATGGSLDKLSTDKIGVLSNALGDLSKFGVLPGTELFDELKGKIDALQSTLTHTPINFKIPINIEPLPAATNDAAIKAVTDGVKQKFADGMVNVSKIVNDALKNGAADGIATIAAGIGEAIAGGGIKAALSGFVDAVANFGQSLGKQLIAQGIALIAFKASLDSLSGPQAIVAGAALVAASAAFKALAKGGVSAFATGGTVYGPQLALVGDNPGREEHIIPSEVLDKLSGSNSGQLQFSLGVQDFIVWLERGYRNG